MGWIFARVVEEGSSAPERGSPDVRRLHPTPLHVVDEAGVYLAAGGLAETCLFGRFNASANEATGGFTGWCVVGLGLRRGAGRSAFLGSTDWERLLAEPDPKLSTLDGHFLALRWRRGEVEGFTDPLGLRTLYVLPRQGQVLLATQVGWIARAVGGLGVDFTNFGSHWLGLNQLLPRSFVSGVTRLGQGARVRCTPSDVVSTSAPYDVGAPPPSEGGPMELLGDLAAPLLDAGKTLSLGLSGGLDSRTLLAVLLRRQAPFALHVFGPPDDPDVAISSAIARDLHIEQVRYPLPLPDPTEIVAALPQYAAVTRAATPASALVKLGPYGDLHERGRVVIDGGLGEIARRRYLNRLRRIDLARLSPERASVLARHLSQHRASIFCEEVAARMNRGFERELIEFWSTMPAVSDVGLDNVLDLVALRTRFPNLAGFEQARLDHLAVSYMPFAQPSFIRAITHAPARQRRNGKLFLQTIREAGSGLERYPLTKGDVNYPFGLSTLAASAWVRVMRKLRPPPPQTRSYRLLMHLKEFVQDTVRSEPVRSYGAYDYPKIGRMATAFYAGKVEHASELDWWLSFELWRRSVEMDG